MRLNNLSPAVGAKKKGKRLGRGIGSTDGKTAGKGHKGQHARKGGYHKVGFEGGQMPMARRLPKFGFTSLKKLTHAEVRLSELAKVEGNDVNLLTLKTANVIPMDSLSAKIVLSGSIDRAVNVSGVRVTKGAMDAIVAAGGKVEA
ncbi:50S ribosomal protein L15 [Permianibacter aggregans]|uniref:Large ribosomal subunit protein uL15 n=1 Tax=Permianibacter aggregans TaxID=1510150 RepID=A0A4R6UXK3_9GAMM|nr:50S ribosomal protein L15 [Permianibacter aggregans]QGX40847.1 50S ribosomal protein L15 [Permianibacter aggregans]TDQ48334.1 LSU ribosomal protein L15P [Permianibacter aggregans]